MPLAIYLGFNQGLELYGFWLGFTIALVFLDSIVGLIVIRSDWSAKSLGEDKVDTAITRSVKITRQNSMFCQSPLLRQDTTPNESPNKKRLNRSVNSSTSSVRVKKARVDDDHFLRQE